MARMWSLLVSVAIAYAAIVALVFLFQSHLVYFPNVGREVAVTPQAYGLAFEAVTIATQDGEKLAAWWVPAPQSRGAVLIFHGNAGNISHRIDYLSMFHKLGYATLIIDYRGYGNSTGSPSEEGTYRDAEAAWRWLLEDRGVKAGDVVLMGESLGGAVAAWLAARVAPRAVVLASTFTSVPDLGAQVYPFLPVRLVSRFSYDNRAAVKAIKAPLLIAHSAQDDIIPYSHGRALFEAANEPKQFLEMKGGHNEGFLFVRQEWVAQLGKFLERAATKASATESTEKEITMERKFINPEGMNRPGTYTPVVTVRGGKTIHISGQVALDERGQLVGGKDLKAQTEQVYRNLGLALKGAGATFQDVVKITTYVVNYQPEYRSLMHEVRSRHFSKENPPASTLVGVQSLATADFLVEVEAVAFTD
jgi:uncharacterized protein